MYDFTFRITSFSKTKVRKSEEIPYKLTALESDSGFEDRNLPISFLFVVYGTTFGDLQYEPDKQLVEGFH